MTTATADPHLSRPVQDADVVHGYRFFFGRDPESPAAVAAKRGVSRRDLLAQLAGAGEYEERLAKPVLAGLAPSGDYFSNVPPRATLAWASSFLPLEDLARARLARAPNWAVAHAAVLGDERMRAAVPELAERLPLADLTARLAILTADLGQRLIVGDLEEATSQVVRGYAIDRNAPDETLGVELWIDDCFVAATRADVYGRDLQERFGGSGRHGFLFEGFTPAGAEDERSLRLEVRESGAKLMLGARRLLWSPAREAHQLSLLTQELRQAKKALEGIETTLRLVSGAMGFTTDRWDAYWRTYYVRTPATVLQERDEALAFAWRPRFDVLVTGGPRDRVVLDATVSSIQRQVEAEPRIRVVLGADAEPPPELSGDYVLLVNAGDRLAPNALHRISAALQTDPRPAMVVLDSDTLDGNEHRDPILRPGFDYDLLLQEPYLGPTAAVRTDVLTRALSGGGGLAADRRSDLWLRVVEIAGGGAVVHTPQVLHHFGPTALGSQVESYAFTVAEHLSRIGSRAQIVPAADPFSLADAAPSRLRISWPIPSAIRAAVIVPTRDRLDLLGPCLASLEASRGANQAAMDIVVVDNNSADSMTLRTLESLALSGQVRVLRFADAFNWSGINNFAARNVDADVLIFLNNDTVVLTPDWCDELCRQALRPEVGAVGPRLLFEDGSIQHAGIILGTAQALAAHEGAGASPSDPGYLGRRSLVHGAAAVTGACLATRREIFTRLGGFDEAQLAIEANDIDYCLRVRHAGLGVIYDPWATLYHFESRSRGHTGFDAAKRRKADEELAVLERRWGNAAHTDPHYNGHFDRLSRPFMRLGPPRSISDVA